MKAKEFLKALEGIDPEAEIGIQLDGVNEEDDLVYYGDTLPISHVECVGEDETFILVDAKVLKTNNT